MLWERLSANSGRLTLSESVCEIAHDIQNKVLGLY